MIRFFLRCALVATVAFIVVACSSESVVNSGFKRIPQAYGPASQVNVICEKEVWEGPVGDSLRWYFMAAYPILPQPEPLFDCRNITPEGLKIDPILKELRNYIVIADLSEEGSFSSRMVIGDLGKEKLEEVRKGKGFGNSIVQDKWATGQQIIYLYGFSKALLEESIRTYHPAAIQRLQQAGQPTFYANAYVRGRENGLESLIKEQTGLELNIPSDYRKAPIDGDVIWLRKETRDVSRNILIHTVPYTDQTQLTGEGIKTIRNELGRKYISTTAENSYMLINDVDLPYIIKNVTLHDRYAVEARGIWEIENDFMGGPFISYLIHNPEKKNLVFVDAFVHAPGKEKRDIMLEMEQILRSSRY